MSVVDSDIELGEPGGNAETESSTTYFSQSHTFVPNIMYAGLFAKSSVNESDDDQSNEVSDESDLNESNDDVVAKFKMQSTKKRRSNHRLTPNKDGGIIDLELQMYLSDADLRSNWAYPLDYWRSRKNVTPNLYNIALAALPIPATSAPSERIFSRASSVLDKNRHNLSDKSLELETFFKLNVEYCDL